MTGGRVVRKGENRPAATLPVARVYVDVPLAHLDRPFDYLVPDTLDEAAVPGCRLRMRFAGKQVDGFLLERVEASGFSGRMEYIGKVVSSEPVLTPDLAALARTVADRYSGMMIDVLRLAIPPRHAKVEAEPPAEQPAPPAPPDTAAWGRYPRGPAFVDALRNGRQAHAVWQALPGEDWPARLAELAATAAAHARGAVIVVPDYRDVARVHAACVERAGADNVVALSADAGPAKRYRAWLAVKRGAARIVVGTRASVFAPVHDPGLFVVWDDGDDLHADPHAPYPHVRDVLIQRAHTSGASLLVAGFARTAEAQLLVESGWAPEIVAARDEVRKAAPRITSLGETDQQLARDPAARAARIPSVAFEAARDALKAGRPVLVQVPRGGYVPALACQQCRGPARCRRCAGPLGLPVSGTDARPPTCRWCGVPDTAFRCGNCGSRRLRAIVVGAKRTAEELGRAFAEVPVLGSGAKEVLRQVDERAALVVATPGAEPVAVGGYGAALLLDGWALLGRADLRATEETLRRWMTAAALVRSGQDGGRVVVLAESALPPVQALVRWDPVWHAGQELAARTELGFPPAVRMASVDGPAKALATFLDELDLPPSGEVLGPVPLGEPDRDGNTEKERALVRATRAQGRALAAALATAQHARTARKEPESIRVRLDPLELI
ncbi:primosomal protein N' [Actinophytocola algeriensis]|uniref:Probable replication restart protein PriA n=1 Tax=Actinophytocola algeriensis TaxID=1768010 RepID=A0A7W7Q8J4_9PSEU|nr:primosomal protein N' [Actinophytocola algeriensis]MBB4909025.1 primosomal protein N' (replication factor Y) [Actinophytocola algeriensis]MBE1474587.1 primosomal protein N' (replication factor Y) [Actinophytocola algeriensis]